MKSKTEFDTQLVELAKTDSDAFAQLYDYFFPKVFAFVISKVGSNDAAEDIVSEVFIKVVQHLPKYQDRGAPFAAWLFTIARNMVFDYYSKQSKDKSTVLEEGLEIKDESKNSSPHEQAKHSELHEKVKQVMQQLPERDLNVMQMKFYSGLTNREIAATLNLTESNVGIIIYRVLKKLKPDLNNYL
ncbi:sigma-70 family RNA polymerase sigma factor [Candidatus Peregrinibacteria bacterium]|nr:sigma-70 family RNA polymerase sigma factor [Candidatus Peregrinibacteria bacterium]